MASDDRETKAPAPVADSPAARATAAAGGVAKPILVLGMHRSGTSAVARLVAAAGAYAGADEELLPPHPRDNPQGYWERNDLMLAHDRFLRESGYAWDRVAGFDAGTIGLDARRAFEARLREIVAPLGSRGTPWLVKDPRLCLLLPLWLPLASDAACVVVVRNPREIAASLRDTHRGVFTSVFPVLLWEKYMRTLLDSLAGRCALFVAYEELMRDPRGQFRRLQQGLAALGVRGLDDTGVDPARLCDARLHRNSVEAHVNLTPEQTALYDWLAAQARLPGPVEVRGYPRAPAPDVALAEFERAFDHHARLGRESTLPERDSLRAEADKQIRRANEARIEADAVAAKLTETTHERDRLRRDADAAHVHAENMQRLAGELRGHIAELQQGMQSLRTSWSWKLTAPLRALAGLFRWRPSARAEQRLFRWYYAIPGISSARKRDGILWLHRHARWLTQHTLSYQIHARSEAAVAPPPSPAVGVAPRMDAARAEAVVARMPAPVLISIVMPVYNVERRWLLAAVDSVRRQFYPHWQLCIADDASTRAETIEALREIEALGDIRIHVRRLPRNLGIAGASNAALGMATGAYVGLLDHDDALARDALLEVAQAIAARAPDILYSDEDKLEPDGRHAEPHFKPDFNIDYFFSINYVCHFSVLRRTLIERIGGFRSGYEGAQDYDLLLRATEQGERVEHIPKVLYHWRKTTASTAAFSGAKAASWEAGQRALADSLTRRGIAASVQAGPYPNTFRLRRAIAGQPLVSILVPFRDKPELLSTCFQSILVRTDYSNFEIIGIDNGSSHGKTLALMRKLAQRDARVRFVQYDAPFNYSKVNNFGARHARGEHLLLLNNDTEVIAAEWLDAMLEHSQRPEVGVVGAKLLYADRRIQHAGVIIGIGGVAGHAHLNEPADRPGYFGRAQLVQDLSAVTFACAMTRRDVFEQLGGLNEDDLTIAFNDIDYCLRAREAGYLVVYTPYAELYHYESRTRGYEDDPAKQARFFGEITYMQRRHAAVLKNGDPYYNPNLRLDTNDFSPLPGYVEALPV